MAEGNVPRDLKGFRLEREGGGLIKRLIILIIIALVLMYFFKKDWFDMIINYVTGFF